MPILMWDASALAKRYVPEAGSNSVDALFALLPPATHVGTALGYAEIYSILLRKRNQGAISGSAFTSAKTLLRDEVVRSLDFTLLTVNDSSVFAGIALMEKHNINATDAAVLTVFMEYKRLSNEPCVLVASDQRLVLAAQATRLSALNPELVAVADIPAFFATL